MVKPRGRVARDGEGGVQGARTRLPMACVLGFSFLFPAIDGLFRSRGQPTRAAGGVRFAMADAGADCTCRRAAGSRGRGPRMPTRMVLEFQRRYGIGMDVTKWGLNLDLVVQR